MGLDSWTRGQKPYGLGIGGVHDGRGLGLETWTRGFLRRRFG